MKSWKTTVAGLLAISGGALAQFFPKYAALGNFLASIGGGAGLLFARDNNVSSEAAGIVPSKQQDDPRQRTLPLALLALLGVLLLASGCASQGSYKAAAVTVVTAEQASDAWLDYYVAARKVPGADTNRLDAYDRDAAKAWHSYQASMDTVYHTRKAVAAGIESAEQLQKALAASREAAGAVVRLVLLLLPPERVEKMKGSP